MTVGPMSKTARIADRTTVASVTTTQGLTGEVPPVSVRGPSSGSSRAGESFEPLQPLEFVPWLRPQIWGGRALVRGTRQDVANDLLIGESWELCGLPQRGSVLKDAATALRLDELWGRFGSTWRGGLRAPIDFPWLIKRLECRDWLSMQVHPDEQAARRHGTGTTGKFETWYVVDASPDAEILVGPRPGVTLEDIRRAAADPGDPLIAWRPLLDSLRVATGDFVVIPAGTIHTARGVELWEIQTPSEITYRLCDWGRVGFDGRPRELHVDQACDAINDWPHRARVIPASQPVNGASADRRLLLEQPFRVEACSTGESPVELPLDDLTVVCAVAGECELLWDEGRLAVTEGSCVLLPAPLKKVTLAGTGNAARILSVTFPTER